MILLLTVSDLTPGVLRSSLGGTLLFLLLICIVPLLCYLFLPVGSLGDLIDPVLDDGQSLTHLVIFHILLVVKLVGKFEKIIDFGLFSIFLHCLCLGPCWPCSALFPLFARNRGCLLRSLGLCLEIGSCQGLWS